MNTNRLTKEIFKENLIGILAEAGIELNKLKGIKFKMIPITEEGKTQNSIDDVVRLWAYHGIKFSDNLYPIEHLITVLSVVAPKFPLWIHINTSTYLVDKIIRLEVSMRFRKPSELHNKEFGFPPFKIIA